ncbi:putative quinol monooxygenase [Pelagerythrobacter aerophilus]
MATEIARIDVAPGDAEAFVLVAAQAVELFRGAPGCSGMRLLRSHEAAARFWLIVEWQDVAAHEAFRASPAFAEWRGLVGRYFAAPPAVEHGLATGVGF